MPGQIDSLAPTPLKNIPLFSGFSDAERDDLRRLLQPRTLEAQRAVFWIGEPGNEFYIIEHGQVVICYPDEGGREVTLAVLGPGQFFGELSLLDGGRRTATARTQREVRLLSLGREQFHDFLRRHPAGAVHVLEVLGRRQRDNLDKLRGIKNANEAVEERQTPVQRVVERVASVFASEVFLVANLIFVVTWIFIQTVRYNEASAKDPQKFPPVHFFDQPPTFFWLGFMVTIEAIILSVFVLNAQRRQAQRDSIKADLDYQVNRKAQLEIMQLHEKLDRLQAMLAEPAGRGASEKMPEDGNGAQPRG
jgi:CRP/FNR family transcriptional regulator, cyclic AMP receptor protein